MEMKIVGIIAEYNPMHNGHMYHLEEINKEKPDIKILVLSGALTMRGDLSIYNKFIKAKEALQAGIDIVIELPLAYSMQRADIFASNALAILNLAKVNEIIIGSENNEISLYESIYKNNIENRNKDTSMKESSNQLMDLDSNDTLGYFYYKSIQDHHYNIFLKTIKRLNSKYKDKDITGGSIQSATAIRANLDEMEKYVPSFVSQDREYILDENMLFPYLKYKILSTTVEDLKNIFFVDEGIEYKLKNIKDYDSLDSFIEYLSNKKYTKTRMKRMLMYILFNIKKDEMNKISPPNYLRVLGYSNKGKEYLNQIKKDVPIYTNIKEGVNNTLDIELKISKILDSIYHLDLLKKEQKGPITKE